MATGNVISTLQTANKKTNQVIDGFVKGPRKISAAAQASRRQLKSTEFHKRTQKAQTLMRQGLTKPSQRFQSNINKFSPKNREREQRAAEIAKHSHVDRFGGALRPKAAKPSDVSHTRPVSGELINKGGALAATQQAPAPLPSMITSASHQKLERLLDEALVRADAHKQALKYQAARHFWQRSLLTSRRRWAMGIALLLVVISGVFMAWQKIPQLSMKVAGMQAHIAPAVPSYKPEGYSLAGPAKASSGAVTVQYKAAADDNSSFTIHQAQSNLTSTSLAQSVIPKGSTVQTSQVEGNTVYIYGATNDAAWVNNGEPCPHRPGRASLRPGGAVRSAVAFCAMLCCRLRYSFIVFHISFSPFLAGALPGIKTDTMRLQ